MIPNEIVNSRTCEKCGKTALGMVHTILVCGECMIKWDRKQKEKAESQRKMILEEMA